MENEKNKLFQDTLTASYTKEFFFETGKILLQLAKRNQVPLMVGVVDIDNYEEMMGQYGEDFSNKISKLSTELIENKTRTSDIVAYMGEGKIGLLFYNTSNVNAKIALENIREKVEKNDYMLEDKNIDVTVSIGAISMHNLMSAGAITALYEQADNAANNASKKGKNCVVVY